MSKSKIVRKVCETCGGDELPCVFCSVRKSQNSEVCNISLVSVADLAAIGVAVGVARNEQISNEVDFHSLNSRWAIAPVGTEPDEDINPKRRIGQTKRQLQKNYECKQRPRPNENQQRWNAPLVRDREVKA